MTHGTLFAAAEGWRPFDERTALSMLWAVQYKTAPPARHPGWLRPLIDGLLTMDPDRRLGSLEAQLYLERASSPCLANERVGVPVNR
jgi:hypothetical protein